MSCGFFFGLVVLQEWWRGGLLTSRKRTYCLKGLNARIQSIPQKGAPHRLH